MIGSKQEIVYLIDFNRINEIVRAMEGVGGGQDINNKDSGINKTNKEKAKESIGDSLGKGKQQKDGGSRKHKQIIQINNTKESKMSKIIKNHDSTAKGITNL